MFSKLVKSRRNFNLDKSLLLIAQASNYWSNFFLLLMKKLRNLDQRWKTVDRLNFGIFFLLIATGTLLSFSSSPPAAQHLLVSESYFMKRHLLYLVPSVILLAGLSLTIHRKIKNIAIILYLISLAFLITTSLIGLEVRGSRRWMMIKYFSFQPSEFVKPSLVIVCAWIISYGKDNENFPGVTLALFIYSITIIFLVLQPNIGTSILISLVFFTQLFLFGLSIKQAGAILALCFIGLGSSYLSFSHVMTRINSFLLQGKITDKLTCFDQTSQALQAFRYGGLSGRGPGEGLTKLLIPDIHSDFIFAIAGEEFGVILCLLIAISFWLIIVRTLKFLLIEKDLFIILSSAGLVTELGLQAFINITSTLGLIPTSGVTLPFISYGGSSFISTSFGMGSLLALTRRIK